MDFHLDIHLGTIERPGEDPVRLTRSERSALELLSSNPNRVITRDQLLDAVSEPGSDKSDRNVDFLINRLRRKLSDDARRPRFIATRYGEGYVWIADAPLSLGQIAEADAVIGPVHGLDLLPEREAASGIARDIAKALSDAFGDDKRVVYAPDCPPPDQFGALAPHHSAEITFFADHGSVDCIIAVREFRSGRIIFARRLGLDRLASGTSALNEVSAEINGAIWRARITAPSRAEPLPIALLTSGGGEEIPPSEPETASHRRLLSRHSELEHRSLSFWEANDRRLRAELAKTPDDPELKLLIALNTQSKYATGGSRLFMSGNNRREADEDEIEDFVTSALPAIRGEPEYVIIAGKLLHFLRRGYDELAKDLCEGAYAQSVAVGRSLSIIGQMRAFFGETDAAVQCLDQALYLARPGSHAHLYGLVIKCQALAAAGRWDELQSARRELSGINSIAGFVLEPMFGRPDAPSIRARAMTYLVKRDRAYAMLMHKYYVSARLFRDPEHGANSIRALAGVFANRFGHHVIPDEVRSAFPAMLSD